MFYILWKCTYNNAASHPSHLHNLLHYRTSTDGGCTLRRLDTGSYCHHMSLELCKKFQITIKQKKQKRWHQIKLIMAVLWRWLTYGSHAHQSHPHNPMSHHSASPPGYSGLSHSGIAPTHILYKNKNNCQSLRRTIMPKLELLLFSPAFMMNGV